MRDENMEKSLIATGAFFWTFSKFSAFVTQTKTFSILRNIFHSNAMQNSIQRNSSPLERQSKVNINKTNRIPISFNYAFKSRNERKCFSGVA